METREHNPLRDDLAALYAAGMRGAGQYRCVSCGYGITVHADLPACAMCAGTSWEQSAWSPFARGLELLSG